MDTCRQRLRRTTSLVACLLLVLVLASEVSDAHAAKLRHKRRNHSVRAVSSTFTTSRRLTRLGRSISLPEAENCTACAFKVEVDVVENRMPRAITQVRCVQEGGPCKTAENRGLWRCTQLVSYMTVSINNQQRILSNIPYACVCAREVALVAPTPEYEPVAN